MVTESVNAQVKTAAYDVVCEHGSLDLLDQYADEWRKLCQEGPCDEPFYSPEWAKAYFSALGGKNGVFLLIVRRSGTVRGILPLDDRRIGWGPVRLHWFRTSSNSHFPRFDVIHGAGDIDEVAMALWDFLHDWHGWDMLQFESAPGNGMAARIASMAVADGAATRAHNPGASPQIDIAAYPSDVDGIISSLSRKPRSHLRRSIKRLREMGDVRFQVHDGSTGQCELEAAIEEFYRLEAETWKGKTNTAIVSDASRKHLYDALVADALAKSSLVVCQLLCNDWPVAIQLNIRSGDTLYGLKSSFDTRFQMCSPGQLAIAYAVQSCAGLGLTRYDLCGRADPYKLVWTQHTQPFAAYYIANITLRGRCTSYLLDGMYRGLAFAKPRIGRLPVPGKVVRFFE